MNLFKDSVGLCVATPSWPPTLNDSSVVTEYLDPWRDTSIKDYVDEKFHTDCFCSSNIPSFLSPAWDWMLCLPPVINNNANAHLWAGVRESSDIGDGVISRGFSWEGG